MKNRLLIISLLFLAACGGNEKSVEVLIENGDVEALKAKRSEIVSQIKMEEEEVDKISLYLESLDSTDNFALVNVLEIKSEYFNHYVELQGSVETDQNIIVYPEVQGTLLDLKVKMGDRVSKGQIILIIDDGGMQQQLSQVKQKAELSKIIYEKRKRLWGQEIGSEIDYLQAKTQFNADEEMVSQMKKQLSKATVRAPFSGLIDETIADEGQLLIPGQTALFRIVNLNDMYINADVPEKYLLSIQVGKKVLVDLPVIDTAIISKIKNVSNYINPDNRTFKIKIDVPNTNGLIKPNLTSRLRVNDYTNENAILIPLSIISEDSEGKQYVYRIVKNEEGSINPIASKVFISTGRKMGDNIEILSGLKVKDFVIEEGARLVKDKQKVQIIK